MDVEKTELVEIDVTPDRWNVIKRSRLAFGLLTADLMAMAPREMIVSNVSIRVIIPKHMKEFWDMRSTQRNEQLLFLAQRTEGAMTQLSEFLDGGWIV